LTVIINVIGFGRRSGKTTLIEAICRKLADRFHIWTVKHISSSFDSAHKDTWRHLHAGAKAVIAISPEETIILKKNCELPLDRVLHEVPLNVTLILIEGFKKSNYPKIVVAHNVDEARKIIENTSQVFAIFMNSAENELEKVDGIPILKLDEVIQKIEEMIREDLTKQHAPN